MYIVLKQCKNCLVYILVQKSKCKHCSGITPASGGGQLTQVAVATGSGGRVIVTPLVSSPPGNNVIPLPEHGEASTI